MYKKFFATGDPTPSTTQRKPDFSQVSHSRDQSAIIAMETDKLKTEYELKLAEMQASYEAELMSKKRLQDEIERLQNDYSRKVHDVEEQYGKDTTAKEGVSAMPTQSDISMIGLGTDIVSTWRSLISYLPFLQRKG